MSISTYPNFLVKVIVKQVSKIISKIKNQFWILFISTVFFLF